MGDYRLAFRIEGERRPPNAVIGVKLQFLHIGVFRAFQRIDARAARRRAEGFDYGLMLMVRNKKMGPRFTLAIPLNMLRKISGSPS